MTATDMLKMAKEFYNQLLSGNIHTMLKLLIYKINDFFQISVYVPVSLHFACSLK